MPSIDPKIIDELRALQTAGSPTFLAELIDIFLKEQRDHLKLLRQAFDGRDGRVLEKVAHTMKGSCGNLGARELSKACADLQRAANAADWAGAGLLVARIEREAVTVEAELRAEKSRPS